MLLYVNILVTISAFVGILLLSHKKRVGFLIFFGVEACFIYIGLKTGQYGLITTSIVYFFANIYGFYQWRKDDLNG